MHRVKKTKNEIRIDTLKKLQPVLALILTVGLLLMSISVIWGWFVGHYQVTHLLPNYPSMTANTAVGFLLLSIAQISLWTRFAKGCSLVIGAILIIVFSTTLIEYWANLNLGIDNWIITNTFDTVLPGRPAQGTSISFILAAIALIANQYRLSYMPLKMDFLMAIGGLLPLIAISGYFFNPEGLFKFSPMSTMAVHTTTGFILFWGGFALTHKKSYIFQLLFERTPGGRQVRRLIIPVIAIPLLCGLAYKELVSHNILDPLLALAIFATNFIIFSLATLVWNAILQNKWFADLHTITEDNLETKLQLAIVMDSSMGAIFLFSEKGDVISVNQGATHILGWSYPELQNMNVMQLVPEYAHRRLLRIVTGFRRHASSSPLHQSPIRLIARRKDCSEVAIQASVSRHKLHGQWVYGVLLLDAQSLVDHIKQLSRDIHLDPLTLAYNRRALDYELKKMRDFGLREGQKFAIIMVDIDHFKEINDKYGHEAGDIAIKTFARRIRLCLRYHDRLYRYGGDEFIIIAEATEFGQVPKLAQRIEHAISDKPIHYQRDQIHLTSSIGICAIDGGGDLVDICMRGADQALYKAKQLGRNRIEICDDIPFSALSSSPSPKQKSQMNR
ncbi:diguanylate cyclase [Celerinatantimonas sp. YJH-8]|uniref:sensor domain-containing diguanylate cyclase n=1 Tax=Celerinatantimonas sp. YJH-8 TaxID=3228714 RepID=UPI0038C7EB8F